MRKRDSIPPTPKKMHSIATLRQLTNRVLRFFTYILLPSMAHATPAFPTLENTAIDESPNTVYQFEAYAKPHPLASTYREDFHIILREKWPSGVSFQYFTEQKVLGDSTGTITLSSLDDCKSLDPWWDPNETLDDAHCELWIPKKLYLALITSGVGYLPVDTQWRRDTSVRWELKDRIPYRVEIDGHTRILDALHVESNRDDVFIILEDIENPLILSVQSQFFSWKLLRVSHPQRGEAYGQRP